VIGHGLQILERHLKVKPSARGLDTYESDFSPHRSKRSAFTAHGGKCTDRND
jgi:hypothetical protein